MMPLLKDFRFQMISQEPDLRNEIKWKWRAYTV